MIKPSRWILACLVALAFLAPLKFGAPVVVQSLVPLPDGVAEWVFCNWPNQLAVMFVFATLIGWVLDHGRLRACVDPLFILPVIFLMTQVLATPGSICRQLTADTLVYFTACVLVFYAAAWYVRDGAAATRVFMALGLATLVVLVVALEQYFGGLQETREFAAQLPNVASMPPELLGKLTTNRVFGTLVYPNALAGYLVLVFAPVLAWIWVRARGWDGRVKWATLLLVGGLLVWCLFLTGSRGGLLAFVAAVVAGGVCLAGTVTRRVLWLTTAVVVVFMVGFLATHRRGGGSFAARQEYWQGALAIAHDHPWVGTGPGTFGSIYPSYKTGMNEEAQLAHNSYLQMWSDSGVLAFVVFTGLWVVAIGDAYRLARQREGDVAAIALCAALTGWGVHGLVDFDLYVPGIALPAFVLLGTLQGLKELPEVREARSHRHRSWLLGVLGAGVVGAVLWSQGMALMGIMWFGRAQQLLADGQLDAAGAAVNQAILLTPYNGRFHGAAGEVAAARKNFSEAVAQYHIAVLEDPYRPSYHWRLAQVEMAANGVSQLALNELRRAVALNPTQREYRRALAVAEERVRQAPRRLLESGSTKE